MSTRVELVCGLGGVGKTTLAAALGVAHACAGLRVVVLTIDPAHRLADALGLQLGAQPQQVTVDAPGTLHAMMLDPKQTFDGVIRRSSRDRATAERVLANRYYQAVSSRLGGANEYMALEALLDLVRSDAWDVVVVDTPPAAQAMDFFLAPRRVERVFDSAVINVLVRPRRGLIAATTRTSARLVQRLAGGTVLEDIGDFFRAFADLSPGFRERGIEARRLLESERTSTWLVVHADDPLRAGALTFLAFLREQQIPFAGFLANRAFPDPGIGGIARADLPPAPPDLDPESWSHAMNRVWALVDRARTVHAGQSNGLSALARQAAAAVWPIPELEEGVGTLQGLVALAPALPAWPRAPS